MPRKYVRKPSTRAYGSTSYSDETLDEALRALKAKTGLSYGKAAKQFKIPKSTLQYCMRTSKCKKYGGQPYLSETFEKAVVEVLDQLGDWKIPLSSMELRNLVKNYLDIGGVNSKFPDNMPGRDWARGFIKRHGLRNRYPSPLKSGRSKLSRESLAAYFEHLRESLDGVDPSQVYNYDETNFTDDPTRKKCIVRRGIHRHERSTNFSKQAFSVMFCGSATGVYLPPMIVYKAKHMYDGWAKDGIKGAKYSATESGWFNMTTFEQWFDEIFLPHVRDVEGPKVLIGDNHGSHFSPRVIEKCIEHKIRFVTILPNSTHICQPLDVSVFRPLKVLWRAVLDCWRKESRRTGTIPKETFPRLLARAFAHVKGENLVAGFKASGIVPLNCDEVFKRLPGSKVIDDESDMTIRLSEAVLSLLKDQCGFGPATEGKGKRGRKVTPGKALSSDEEIWICGYCKEVWVADDDNRWILCEECDTPYHLQCSGYQYRKKDYDIINIVEMRWACETCEDDI